MGGFLFQIDFQIETRGHFRGHFLSQIWYFDHQIWSYNSIFGCRKMLK